MRAMLAVDLEPGADRLVERAVAWARRTGAELHLRAVSGLVGGSETATAGPHMRFVAREWIRLRTWEWDRVEALAEGVPLPHRGTARVLQGKTWKSLVDASSGYDLMIVGSAGREGLLRYILGSISETVAFAAQCPVLVLPDEADPMPIGPDTAVFCPIDADRPDLTAAAWARDHLRTPVRYELAHALPPSRELERQLGEGEVLRRHPDADRARARLDDAAASAGLGLTRTHVTLSRGDNPAPELSRLADEVEADLIAITTRSRPLLARLVAGSVTEQLIRDGSRPILVAH